MKRIVAIFFILGLGIILFSCQKEDSLDAASEDAILKSATVALTDSKLEAALTEAEYESDFYSGIVSVLGRGHFPGMKFSWQDPMHYKGGKGPDVTVSGTTTVTYPKTIILDYGTGTEIHHGKILKGVVKIEMSAAPRTDGSTRTITYTNFEVDSVKLNGVSIAVFNGDNKTTAVENYSEQLKINYLDGKEITWSGEKKRSWVGGLSSQLDRSDDVINITGKSNAKITGGSVYVKEITQALVRKGSCRYIVAGAIQLTVDSKLISTVDYGAGECDATATLTKDGTTVTLDLTKNTPDIPHHRKK